MISEILKQPNSMLNIHILIFYPSQLDCRDVETPNSYGMVRTTVNTMVAVICMPARHRGNVESAHLADFEMDNMCYSKKRNIQTRLGLHLAKCLVG